ncbi:recombinase family protein [Arundinibacter roseus]|uniref:recombinase family protein n=1 Tax=Arundinibacter roseus TaxID=2070510 RepID=UPI0018FE4C7D
MALVQRASNQACIKTTVFLHNQNAGNLAQFTYLTCHVIIQNSLSEAIDTGTATGNLFFQFMCVLDENECNVIREQTKAGLESARARGRSGGRSQGLSERYQKIAVQVKDMYARNVHSADATREMVQMKSQPTFY